jgi:hypothetical protein
MDRAGPGSRGAVRHHPLLPKSGRASMLRHALFSVCREVTQGSAAPQDVPSVRGEEGGRGSARVSVWAGPRARCRAKGGICRGAARTCELSLAERGKGRPCGNARKAGRKGEDDSGERALTSSVASSRRQRSTSASKDATSWWKAVFEDRQTSRARVNQGGLAKAPPSAPSSHSDTSGSPSTESWAQASSPPRGSSNTACTSSRPSEPHGDGRSDRGKERARITLAKSLDFILKIKKGCHRQQRQPSFYTSREFGTFISGRHGAPREA